LTAAAEAPKGPVARRVAAGAGWSVEDVVCDLGPETRPGEERFGGFTIAAVVGGGFDVGTASGRAQLYPGAFLLGNDGACFACGHSHGRGDRCIAFHFEPQFFEEIAATAGGSFRFRFAAPMLPAGVDFAWATVESLLAAAGEGVAAEELAMALAGGVIRAIAGRRVPALQSLPRERRRVLRALRHIEEHGEEPLSLDDLAAVACMSKFHFLRCFRAVAGVTPHQYLLALRLRRAAWRLRTSAAPISAIAFESGFGDLSTFNARFRAAFGASPRRLRARARLPV
jgi:AraC-like DNA-binding protein